ncbi:MAG: hypothetical protein EXR70_08700 [Deltaproteobacteria bacterium]|nr:hypothetical protein [Deltaproteobacteria bacterium]
MLNKCYLRSFVFAAFFGFLPLLAFNCAPATTTQSGEEVSMVLGARKMAPPPPSTAPSRVAQTAPAFYYEPVGPFFFYVETLTANAPNKYGYAPTQPCIQSGVFKRGMKIVVRFDILDTSTGKRVTDKDGATVKLVLPHGEEVPGRWNMRGGGAALPGSAWMWDTSWDIPPDYPLGSFDYRIDIATKDGRKMTFSPPIQKATTADSRVRIID